MEKEPRLLEVVEVNRYDPLFDDWDGNEKHTLEIGQFLKISHNKDGSATIDLPREGVKVVLEVI